MFQNLLWVYVMGMAWMSVRFPGLKFCPSPPLCGTIRQEDPCKYRISFPALEITQGAEGLRYNAEVALVLLDR